MAGVIINLANRYINNEQWYDSLSTIPPPPARQTLHDNKKKSLYLLCGGGESYNPTVITGSVNMHLAYSEFGVKLKLTNLLVCIQFVIYKQRQY